MNGDAWRDTRHIESRCPFCDHRLDGAGSPEGAAPSPGDLSICISYASPLLYDEGLLLRALSRAEWEALSDDARETLRRYQLAVRSIDRRELGNGD